MKAPVNLARHQAGITLAAAFGFALFPGGSQADVFTSAASQATARQSAAAAPTRTITGGSVDGGGAQISSTMPSESTSVFTEDAPSGTTTSTAADTTPSRRRSAAPSSAGVTAGAAVGPKGGMVAPPVEYAATPGPVWTVEGGYQSKYVWRGLEIPQWTAWNEIAIRNQANGTPVAGSGVLQRQDSDVYFLGANVAWNGLTAGVKYVETLDDGFNAWYDPSAIPTDSYSEWIFTLNYTMALAPDRWLDATLGFDFYYYPNEYFWGAEHQGLAYLNFIMPRYQWAQPYVNIFYNVETASFASGNAVNTLDLGLEGWGFNVGVQGGGQIAEAGIVGFGVSYGVDFLYKDGYSFEPSGFTHATASLAFPVTIGENFTVTPSVSYVERLKTQPGAGWYDDPGLWWGIKATGTF